MSAPSNRWWLAALGTNLVWARLRLRDSGVAEVFDCDGRTLTYDSEDSAHAALLDAEFRAYDGLDEDDALALGFSLATVTPPQARDDEALRELMIQSLPTRQ
ncbi:MAG: hypothetical protein LKM32_10965 [Chiayiivirga sp.]|jgi:hypothetical protein|uniref:hypothetical protein n=1 Tax=Chiayiivirga sp. TaxID=2041042 RepID=UPI0025B9A9CA|nr:hypothetical protein [Chiayiivirga sp.]MCI1709820.1 hypothetical protein [Chiayiivirga sp.]MCI1729871.1 hypothetical protein [Chiayiivirga sp.]